MSRLSSISTGLVGVPRAAEFSVVRAPNLTSGELTISNQPNNEIVVNPVDHGLYAPTPESQGNLGANFAPIRGEQGPLGVFIRSGVILAPGGIAVPIEGQLLTLPTNVSSGGLIYVKGNGFHVATNGMYPPDGALIAYFTTDASQVSTFIDARTFINTPGAAATVAGVASLNSLQNSLVLGVSGPGLSVQSNGPPSNSVLFTNTGVISFNGVTGNVTGAASVVAGSGITVTGTPAAPVVANSGVLGMRGSSGPSLTGTVTVTGTLPGITTASDSVGNLVTITNTGVTGVRLGTGGVLETGAVTLQAGNSGITVADAGGVFSISNSGGTVTNVIAGNGVSLINGTTTPTITNTGVIAITPSTGISNSGTTQNPVLSNTGVLTVGASTGVPSAGAVTIAGVSPGITTSMTGATVNVTNTGVLTTTAGAGINIGGTVQNPTIGNAGVITVTSPDASIVIGGTAASPTLSNAGVRSVTAGTGITTGGTAQDPVVNNSGVLAVTAGNAGITVSGTQTSLQVANAGVLSVAANSGTAHTAAINFNAGTGVTIGDAGGGTFTVSATGTGGTVTNVTAGNSGISVANGSTTPTISNTGVTSAVAGSGIGVSASTGAVTVSNTGVTSTVAGSGIGVSASTGAVTVSNTGVTSAVAGSGIGVSAGTGAVTVSNTGVLSIKTGASAAEVGAIILTPGAGVSIVDSPAKTFTITNTGVTGVKTGASATEAGTITLTAGTGVTITDSPAGTFTVNSTVGTVTNVTAGNGGISVASGTTTPVITNTGVLSVKTAVGSNETGIIVLATGVGISVTDSPAGTFTFANTGVTSNVAGTGISVSGGTGAVTITNTGVTSSAVADPSIVVSSATGAVTTRATGYFPASSGGVISYSSTSSVGTITQSGTSVSGSGTAFSNAMVGGMFVPATGSASEILAGPSPSITVAVSQTIAAGTAYVIYYGGSSLGSDGNLFCKTVNTSSGELTLHPDLATNGAGVTIVNTSGNFGMKILNGSISGYVPTYINSFTEVPVAVTWVGPWANQSGTLYFSRIGKTARMTFSGVLATFTSTVPIDTLGALIPAPFLPNITGIGVPMDVRQIITVRDNGADLMGNILVGSNGGIRISTGVTAGGTFTGGTIGFFTGTVSWGLA